MMQQAAASPDEQGQAHAAPDGERVDARPHRDRRAAPDRGQAAPLARTLRLYVDGSEIERRLTHARRRRGSSGGGRARPQIFFGGLDMLRFVIEPASRDYYRQKGISFGFHQLLRVLDDPVSMIDPTGFLSERDTIVGHVMQVVHLNPVYDLQLIQMFPDGLEDFERQVESMVDGTHPRHAPSARSSRIPTTTAACSTTCAASAPTRRRRRPSARSRRCATIPRFAAAERTFATLPGFIDYCNKLPRDFASLLQRFRRLRQFPLELAG